MCTCVWSYLTVVRNGSNVIKKMLCRQLLQQPRRMLSDLQAEPDKSLRNFLYKFGELRWGEIVFWPSVAF